MNNLVFKMVTPSSGWKPRRTREPSAVAGEGGTSSVRTVDCEMHIRLDIVYIHKYIYIYICERGVNIYIYIYI